MKQLILTGIALAVGVMASEAQQTRPQVPADTERITLDDETRIPKREVALDDILALREVLEPALSPDGQSVAFLVRQAFRDCDCYRTALFLVSVDSIHQATKLLEEELVSGLRWTPDGRFVTYLSARRGSRQLWRVARIDGRREEVFRHAPGEGQHFRESALGPRSAAPVAVDDYEWSPDGNVVAFVTRPATDSATVRALTNDGVVYDDARMGIRDIQLKQWTREPAELWLYDVRSRREHRVWRAPAAGATSRIVGIQGLAWSPDGKRIALSYSAGISSTNGQQRFDLGIVDLTGGSFIRLVATDSMYEWKQVWSRDGTHIAFLSAFSSLNNSGSLSALGVVNVATRQVRYLARGRTGPIVDRLWWVQGRMGLAFEATSPPGPIRERSGLYGVDLASGAVRRLTSTGDNTSSCSASVQGRVACVRQNPSVPPEPAIVDLETGQSRALATVNPQLRHVTLGPVRELRWTNKYGAETNGYLVRPFNYMAGKRYPLLVILYGFQGGFVTAAEWITSYPAQVLARDGFAVLLWNYPRADPWSSDDHTRGAFAVGYSPLASLESAVRLLADQGLVDTTRVGAMGWSYGGFMTELALTHSSIIRVASIGNAGDFNPGAYWASGWGAYRIGMERSVGGPPYGPTLENWNTFSPALNAARVRVPVLMEASSDEAIWALEMFSALRHHRVPVELVIYPDEGHIFSRPAHRLASMQRNLDWFSFWLLGKDDPDPTKHERYEAWRAMRHQLSMLEPSAGAVRCPNGQSDPR